MSTSSARHVRATLGASQRRALSRPSSLITLGNLAILIGLLGVIACAVHELPIAMSAQLAVIGIGMGLRFGVRGSRRAGQIVHGLSALVCSGTTFWLVGNAPRVTPGPILFAGGVLALSATISFASILMLGSRRMKLCFRGIAKLGHSTRRRGQSRRFKA